jgi:hypothetical protein
MSTLELVLLVVGDVVGGVVVAVVMDAFRREPVKPDEPRRFTYRTAEPVSRLAPGSMVPVNSLLDLDMALMQMQAQQSTHEPPLIWPSGLGYMQQMSNPYQQSWMGAMMGVGGPVQPRQKLLPPGGGQQ